MKTDASQITYGSAVPADWDGDVNPGDVDNALDQLAERIDDTEIDVSDLDGQVPQIGSLILFAGDSTPTKYLECDGSAVSRTTYSDLFAEIDTIYGAGDGSTTFNLPDLEYEVQT